MTYPVHAQDEDRSRLRRNLAAAEDAVADLRDQLVTRDRRIVLLEAQLADSESRRTTAVDMWSEAMRDLAPRPRPRCDCPVELDGTRLKQPDCPRHGRRGGENAD